MDELAKAYSANVRPSFFGGVVSTRLQSQNLNKVVPQNANRLDLLKQRKQSRGSSGAVSSALRPKSKPKLTPAEQKAQRQRQLDEKRRRMQARVMAEMHADVGDKFMPEVHGAAAVKKTKSETGAGGAPLAKKTKLDARSPSAAAPITAKHAQSPGGMGMKRMAQGGPPKPVERRMASGQKVMIHTSVPKPRKLGVPKPVQQLPAGPSKAAAPQPSQPSFPSKQCRSCREEKPLTEYYADKRLADGANHMCSTCAKKKGLSGRLLTREEVMAMFPRATKGANGATHSGSGATGSPARPVKTPQPSATCAAGIAQGRMAPSAPRMGSGNAKFYGSSASRGMPPGGFGGRYSGGRMPQSRLDDEYEEDFVVDDVEEEDWRKELSQVTRGLYRERHDDEFGNDRMMEASAADIRREEARSKRIGRLEDAEAEREEEERLAAKAKRAQFKKQKKKRKRKTGVSALIADEAESDSEEDEDEYE
eukprot:jgi/Ulvmu1/9990/UM059_0039.1